MYKVFLVEDEIIMREGLRDSMPWKQYGFTCVGDASDGELALPRIREEKPDVVITDIRMPFLDGLALSHIVRKELPRTKIIILSGYEDFKYAQQAIEIGVEQYLLKPVTKAALTEVLRTTREKLEQESRLRDEYDRCLQEQQKYEQLSRRNFFENLVMGRLSARQIYEEAGRLELDLGAQSYNLVMFVIQNADGDAALQEEYSQPLAELSNKLEKYFLLMPEYVLFRWQITTFAVLVKAAEDGIGPATDRCVESIAGRCRAAGSTVEWYAAAGRPVVRISSLPECFRQVNHLLSTRYLCTVSGVLADDPVPDLSQVESKLKNLDTSLIDQAIVKNFLKVGLREEVEGFLDQYFRSIGAELFESFLFCQYIALNVRFSATAFVESLGFGRQELSPGGCGPGAAGDVAAVREYAARVLDRAIELRDRSVGSRNREVVKKAADYLQAHYADEGLSLNTVAKQVNISANYFSAVFSREMGQTFVEYLTALRMEKAKELLRCTGERSSEIAAAVGYQDPRYFSQMFRRLTGCTPREYRAGGGEEK